MKIRKLIKPLLILVVIGIVLWVGLMLFVAWQEAHVPELDHYDALVVLGAQVKENGAMSLQLQMRVDAAYEAWKKQPCLIVCCGGQGSNEPAPEGKVMRDYLLAKGVPADQVVADTESTTTLQNLQFARRILEERHASLQVCVVTSDYHLPRALALARDVGLKPTGIGSETLPIYWLKNHAREALAWVKYWGQKLLGQTGG